VGLRAYLLFAFLLPCVPICIFRPFLGVILWTIISCASPQWYAWGAATALPTAQLVAMPTLLGFMVFSRGAWNRIISRESILIGIFWMWIVLTSINAGNTPLFQPHVDKTYFRLGEVSKILLMTMITMAIVDTYKRLRILLITIALCFTFYVVKALPFMIMTGGAFRLYGPPHSAVEDNNDLGLALNMTLPLLFFLAQTESDRRWKRLFWFLFAVTIPGIFCTYSRGALVGLIVVALLMVIRLKQRLLLIPVLIMAVLLAAVFAPEKWKDRMNLTNKEATLDLSAQSRFNAWTFSWNLVMDYPIAGGGFETHTRELFNRYAPNTRDVHGPHSVYFGVLAEHGFVGFFIYMGIVASALSSLRKVSREGRARDDHIASSYAEMLQFSIIAFLASGTFLGRAYFDYYFTLVACIVILKRVSKTAWREGTVLGQEEEEQHEEEPAPAPAPGYALGRGI
jgi:probable O-glycosylation ligase (exosortase A-associated)